MSSGGWPHQKYSAIRSGGRSGSTWLHFVPRTLDAAVLAAYGWLRDLTDNEILARLLALNLALAGYAHDPRSP
jgi:hypothetical protein